MVKHHHWFEVHIGVDTEKIYGDYVGTNQPRGTVQRNVKK